MYQKIKSEDTTVSGLIDLRKLSQEYRNLSDNDIQVNQQNLITKFDKSFSVIKGKVGTYS